MKQRNRKCVIWIVLLVAAVMISSGGTSSIPFLSVNHATNAKDILQKQLNAESIYSDQNFTLGSRAEMQGGVLISAQKNLRESHPVSDALLQMIFFSMGILILFFRTTTKQLSLCHHVLIHYIEDTDGKK